MLVIEKLVCIGRVLITRLEDLTSLWCVCGGRGMFRGSFVCVWVCLGDRVCVCGGGGGT